MLRSLWSLSPVLVVAVVVAFLPACPGAAEGEGEGEGEGEASPEDTANAFADLFTRCFNDGFEAQAEPTLTAEIVAEERTALHDSFLAQLDDPKVEFDGAKAAECIAILDGVDCDTLFNGGAEPQECIDVVKGTVAAGDACASGSECQRGLICDGQGADGCGSCATPAGEGEDCTDVGCADGLSCNNDVCGAEEAQPTVGTGDACDEQNLVFCDIDGDECVDNVCTTPTVVQVGAACDNVTLHCIDTGSQNFCKPDPPPATTGICTARPGLGGDCSAIPLCDDTEATCEDGTCVAAGERGDACVDTNPQPCLVGLSCDADSAVCADSIAFNADDLPTCN